MDTLSQMIGLLRPGVLLWKTIEAHGAWALRFPQEENVVFGQILRGSCRLELPGLEPRTLNTGDFGLMAAPASWTLSTGPRTDPVDFDSLYTDTSQRMILVGNPDESSVTRFIAGHFDFDGANADLFTGLKSSTIHIRSTDVPADHIAGLLSLIGDEAASCRPGRSLILSRLLEVVLVESLRYHDGHLGESQCGLLAGLADPQIALALQEMHGDVMRDWTVATLAACVGMSRSVFAKRFTQTVGMAPIDYLRHWRIALSKDYLRYSNLALSEIAALVGYQSDSAFSAAFSRIVGYPPIRYRTLN